MKALRIAVYVMFVQALIPLLAYGMGYGGGTSWFGGYNDSAVNNTSTNNLTDDQIQALGIDEGIATDSGLTMKSFGLMALIANMLEAIFWIYPKLNEVFFIPSPQNADVNAFQPFLILIQLGIYIIYAFAIYELVTGRQVDT